MGLKIVKAEEPIKVEQLVIEIYGQPGIGKSSIAFSAKNPICLDFDRGSHRAVGRKDTAQPESWPDVANLEAEGVLDEYDTVIVDTIGRALDMLTAHLIAEDAKLANKAGGLTMNGWGALKASFTGWLKKLREQGKDVILIAHDAEDKSGDEIIVRPDIQGGSRSEITKATDAIGYLYRTQEQTILDFNPSDRWIGKNPSAGAPITVPNIKSSPTFLADVIQSMKDSINSMTEEQQETMKQLQQWRESIEQLSGVEDFNAMVPKATEAPKSISGDVKKMLVQVARQKGLEFDKASKTFYEPEEAAEEEGATEEPGEEQAPDDAGPDTGDGENVPGQED